MPVVVTDDFTGTNNASLAGRITSGGSWSVQGVADGLLINAANRLKLGGSGAGTLARVNAGSTDHYARLVCWAVGTSSAGPAVRAVDDRTLIAARPISATAVQLTKRVASTSDSSIGVVSGLTLTPPFTLELRVSGTTVWCALNGAIIGPAAGYAVTDSAFAGLTTTGVWARGSTGDPVADDFESGTYVAAAVPAAARHANRAGNAALALRLPLAPAAARAANRAGSAAITLSLLLTPSAARSAHPGAAAALGLRLPLAPAAARSPQRGTVAALTPAAALAPASARSAARTGAASLAITVPLTPTSASSPGRAAATALAIRLGLAPAAGRHASRSAAANVTPGAVPTAPSRAAHRQRAGIAAMAIRLGLAPGAGRHAGRAATSTVIRDRQPQLFRGTIPAEGRRSPFRPDQASAVAAKGRATSATRP
ncbi:MAG: hypothetical protein RQ833_06400 [Sphingomonadaceae bacterium]|nr:hypothetical protein [Sphingomonadaceae bacterium]